MNIMAQIGLHRLILDGIKIIKQNPNVLDQIFEYYTCDALDADYGQAYIDKIKTWFTTTKIPVVQAWSATPGVVPQITIKLATDNEDESKAAVGDHWDQDETGNVGVGVSTVMLDVMLHGTKNTDQVLWLYYIVYYILFKRKRHAEALGLQLGSYSATDYTKDMEQRSAENIWTRVIRYRTTVQNFWEDDPYLNIDNLEVSLVVESTEED